MFLISLQTFRNKPRLYEKLGRLEKWYIERLNIIGTDWCLKFADSLPRYLKNSNPLIFVSPTANKGIYEKAIFRELAKSYCVEMHITDHAEIEEAEGNEEIGVSKFINDGKCDAKKIDVACNVIYDIKGATWHEKGRKFKTLINNYYRILKSDGLLIIDNAPIENSLHIHLHNFLYSVHRYLGIGKKSIRIEWSTLQMLKKKGVESLFSKYFEYIGDIQTEEIGFALYRKRGSN